MSTPPPKEYLSAHDAASFLDIRKETLYAYVSRGLVRSVLKGSTNRSKLYLLDDLERLRVRASARGGHEAAAATAMNLGAPIVPTGITEITPQGPRYRGRLACALVQQEMSFENVAELLWTGQLHDHPVNWALDKSSSGIQSLLRTMPTNIAKHQMQEVLALVTLQLAMGRGPLRDRLRSGRTYDAAKQVILSLTGCFGLLGPHTKFIPVPRRSNVAQGLLYAMGSSIDPGTVRLMNALLVLMADHELSPGAFAARVAASAGASLHSCLAAALSVSAGSEVARLYERADQFLCSAGRATTLLRRAHVLLSSGQSIPGFHHPIYPNGDPRAKMLIELLKKHSALSNEVQKILRFVEQLEVEFGLQARHEVAIIAVCKAINLPTEAPSALFVLARLAGWVAHIQEQRLSTTLLRPRARFVAG